MHLEGARAGRQLVARQEWHAGRADSHCAMLRGALVVEQLDRKEAVRAHVEFEGAHCNGSREEMQVSRQAVDVQLATWATEDIDDVATYLAECARLASADA